MIRVGVFSAFVLLAGCQTQIQAEPAVLREASPETVAQLKEALASAMGRGRVELGPINLTEDPAIPVLPPSPGPYETRSPAMPEMFDLVIREGACFVQARRTGELYRLADVRCRALADD